MNRANFGNQITNGMQIASVGATSAVGFARQSDKARLADASSALNNMSMDEVKAVGEMRADKLRTEMEDWNNRDKKAKNEDKVSIDDLMISKSPQSEHITKKVNNDLDWIEAYKSKANELSEITKILKENDENADI